MKKILAMLSVVMTCALIALFAPQTAHATNPEWKPTISVGETLSVEASEGASGVFYFSPKADGAYELSSQSLPTHTRVFLYEEEEITPDSDSDGWSRLSYYDWQEGETVDYPFIAKTGKTYKIELETNFSADKQKIQISLNNSTRAGVYDGFVWAQQKDHEGRDYVIINGYEGPETGDLVVPGKINGTVVKIIGDWAIWGDFTTITLEEGIEELHNNAISGYDTLTKVSLPSTLNTIYSSFNGSPKLNTIEFPKGSEYFYVQDYNLIEKGSKTIILVYGPVRDEYTAPEGIREIDGYALDAINPKKIWLPASIREVFHMPSSLEEMHIGNPNCEVGYFGIPWTDWIGDDAVYTVKVYAPAGGSLEKYCKENNIQFISEGEPFDPKAPRPIDDPIDLFPNDYAYSTFDTRDGNYQEYVLNPSEDGVHGLDIEMSVSYYTYSLVDSTGTTIKALNEASADATSPGYLFYLKGGEQYTLTLNATDAAMNEESMGDEMGVYMAGPEEFAVGYYDGWEGGNYPSIRVFKFSVNRDDTYHIEKNDMEGSEEHNQTMYLFSVDNSGKVTKIKQNKNSFETKLAKGNKYHLALVEDGYGYARSSVIVYSEAGDNPIDDEAEEAAAEEAARKKAEEEAAAKAKAEAEAAAKAKAESEALEWNGTLAKTIPAAKSIKAKAAKKSIKVTWKKASKKNLKQFDKVEIQVCTDKKFQKANTKRVEVKKSKVSSTIKGLKKGKTYYVRVRDVKGSGTTKKVSKWSKVKKVKVK